MTSSQVSNERVAELLTDIAKEASEVAPLLVKKETPEGVRYIFSVDTPMGGKLVGYYEPDITARFLLQHWDNVFAALPKLNEEGVPKEQTAHDCALAVMALLLGQLGVGMGIALNDLVFRSLAQFFRGALEDVAAASDARVDKKSINAVLKMLLQARQDRDKGDLGIIGPGQASEITYADVYKAIDELGRNANQKTVAARIGKSERALREWLGRENLGSWKEFMEVYEATRLGGKAEGNQAE
jgi:hypothetical protein